MDPEKTVPLASGEPLENPDGVEGDTGFNLSTDHDLAGSQADSAANVSSTP